MDATPIYVTGIIAVIIVVGFLLYRKGARVKFKGPLNTELEFEGLGRS
jgi:hypothetical protein